MSATGSSSDLRCAAVRCGIGYIPTDADLAVLLSQPNRLSGPERAVECELAEDHQGSHIGFVMAADDGDQWWWIRWDVVSHEVLPLDLCPGGAQRGLDDCLLPNGHPGQHSFQL